MPSQTPGFVIAATLTLLVPEANVGTLEGDLIAGWPSDAPQPTVSLGATLPSGTPGEMAVTVNLAATGLSQSDMASLFTASMAAIAATSATLVSVAFNGGPPPAA